MLCIEDIYIEEVSWANILELLMALLILLLFSRLKFEFGKGNY